MSLQVGVYLFFDIKKLIPNSRLHKISCTREYASKLTFRSFALSLHRIIIQEELEGKN